MPAIQESGGGGGGGPLNPTRTVELLAQVDGVNTLFNVSPAFQAGTTRVFWRGQKLTPGACYVEVGTNQIQTIGTPFSPGAGASLQVVFDPL